MTIGMRISVTIECRFRHNNRHLHRTNPNISISNANRLIGQGLES